MLKKFVKIFGGDPNQREIDRSSGLVDQINPLESQFEKLSDEELREKTNEFRLRLAQGESLDEILPEAFTAVREASKRTIGLRHYDVQMIGGAALHSGKIAEMRTGEGKTLVATLPVYLNALALNPDWVAKAERTRTSNPANWSFESLDHTPVGRGIHLVTVNDYLARRDARWMAPIYHLLGLSVGVLQMAARTENGKNAFIVDFERTSPHEDQHNLRMVPRQEAYLADITYGTNSEFGFDYLRDNMTMRLEDRVQRGHYYAIVDEVDNVLIDEARTPLIISGPAQDEAEWYIRMAQIVRALRPEDYEVSEKDRNVTLTEIGESRVEEALGTPLRDPDRPEDILPEQARLMGYLEQALRAQFLYHRNKEYLVQAGKVVIVDEFTGRLMPGRRWSDGLHQAVEAKEGVKVQSESVTYATITLQNYFRMYEKLAGMTGTALTEAEEFDKIYKLGVLAIPTNLEYLASRQESGLEEMEGRDEQGYKYRYYSHKEDALKAPVYWKRKDYTDVVYRTEEAKLRAIAREILRYHVLGRPLLVGTTSVELSERLSNRLRAEPIRRLCQVLLLRGFWLERNNREEDGRQIAELQSLNQPIEKLDTAELRKLARDLNISFNPEDPTNLERLLSLLELPADHSVRLVADLQGGISHQVLNARKHTEESQIIAGAGAYGAVTIATNMAGRGVDIKLGGELAEEILTAVHRVLAKAGYQDTYNMNMEEIRQALQQIPPDSYGVYDAEVGYFTKHINDMERVRELGGLFVIGSERHEARRIDNQLRGRSARQGDPGASRFYLSLEDELMRMFGGQQADGLMQRLKIDDALPLEVGLVGRLVEQSQTRVEGANFDIRKHLLEYDDVLNTQRVKIYNQRDRIFTKQDLGEDVTEMLRVEVNRRVPEALRDEGGPWKLLSWLEQVQPSFITNYRVFPSYSLRLLADHLLQGRQAIDKTEAGELLMETAQTAIRAEQEHVIQSVVTLLEQTEEKLESQKMDRLEAVDNFFEGLDLEDETQNRRPGDLLAELSGVLHFQVRLSPDGQRALQSNPQEAAAEVRILVENMLISQAANRLIGAVERRVEEPLELNPSQLSMDNWNELCDQILQAVERVFDGRLKRYLGDDQSGAGQIQRELEGFMSRQTGEVDRNLLLNLLLLLPQGTKAIFDRKTHRKVWQRTTRLSYIYHSAHFLENRAPDEIAADVLEHLEQAQEAMIRAWGVAEWNRVSGLSLSALNEATRQRFLDAFGEQRSSAIQDIPLNEMVGPERETAIDLIGSQALTEIYRQLLLSIITELWVDYLTQMEGLRISIGLEAYAQRDPLVQYKNRAFGLFQDLLGNMRLAVISRMFTYRPRDLSAAQTGVLQADTDANATSEVQIEAGAEAQPELETDEGEEVLEASPASIQGSPVKLNSETAKSDAQSGGGKRKRRRHR